MADKSVDTLVLDIDNTIFDWFATWYASFEPIYREIVERTGLPEADVQAAIREVHQARRTSEYTFLLEELKILRALSSAEDVRATFRDAIDQSRHNRDHALRLYPGVFRTLWDIKKRGTKIIGYTESMAFYTGYRLKRFGLDGVFDVLFSPSDHDLPAGVSVDKFRRLPDDFYELQVTEVRHTPPGELKPNPRVLRDILKAVGASPEKTAYVGDSLFKDVAMARDVAVFDIHAKYGESQRKPEYDLLRNVSHWTDVDVEREKAIIAAGHEFEASAVLRESFVEIYAHCDFMPFDKAPADPAPAANVQYTVDIWKKTVDVQQHFNDLEMRIRNHAITLVGVLIAAVGFTYQQGLTATFFDHQYPAGLGIVFAAMVAWGGFYLMDRHWYHVLLRGAVLHAAQIEKELSDRVPAITLGSTISKVSGEVRILGITMKSDRRLNLFYGLGTAMLFLVFATLLFAIPNKVGSQPTPLPTPSATHAPSGQAKPAP